MANNMQDDIKIDALVKIAQLAAFMATCCRMNTSYTYRDSSLPVIDEESRYKIKLDTKLARTFMRDHYTQMASRVKKASEIEIERMVNCIVDEVDRPIRCLSWADAAHNFGSLADAVAKEDWSCVEDQLNMLIDICTSHAQQRNDNNDIHLWAEAVERLTAINKTIKQYEFWVIR
jgi:hypothetical protein